jgi:NAD(P)-dependent dehydrogenase (short-subunit alcohol dehydrogenase family)
MGRVDGKVAVVTGAASGIGGAIATSLVREGGHVWFLDRAVPRLPKPEGDAGAGMARAMVVDVTREDEVASAFRAVQDETGRLDVLVHCAAIQAIGQDATAADLDTDVWDRTIEVNLRGSFLVCKYALRAMLTSGHGGSIINCGSPTSMRGSSSDFAAYSSAKGGVHALTRVIATAYGRAGIRANTLVPGPTTTALTAAAFEDPGIRDALIAKTAMGRLGNPDDYAGIALYLASDDSRFATGAEFVVDGGYTMT